MRTLTEECRLCGGPAEGYADLLVGLRGGPARLAARASGLEPGRETASGEWTVGEVLHHLADVELALGFRLRLVLAEDEPPLTPFDPEAWATKLDYRGRDARLALTLFRAARRATVDLLAHADPAAWERGGQHDQWGRLTADEIARHLGHHDLAHLRDLASLR
jgi:hypothetical protein